MKAWWKSKSIWSGVAMILIGIHDLLPYIGGLIDYRLYGWLMFWFGLLAIGLRIVTHQPIGHHRDGEL